MDYGKPLFEKFLLPATNTITRTVVFWSRVVVEIKSQMYEVVPVLTMEEYGRMGLQIDSLSALYWDGWSALGLPSMRLWRRWARFVEENILDPWRESNLVSSVFKLIHHIDYYAILTEGHHNHNNNLHHYHLLLLLLLLLKPYHPSQTTT